MKKYEELALEILTVDSADVITTSNVGDDVEIGDDHGTNPGPSPFAF